MTLDEKVDKVLDHLADFKENQAIMSERQNNMAKDIEFLVKSDQMQEEHIRKLNQTVYGETGNNGLRSDVRLLKRAFIGAQAILGLLMGTIYFFKDTIISLFQNSGGK